VRLARAAAARAGILKLGSVRFDLAPGTTTTVTIKLSAKTRKRLKGLKRIPLRLTVTESSSASASL
jgi:hypothetical protein